MRIAILGGDGFVGWPTCLHLSAQGHEVHILDNLSAPLDRHRAWRAVPDPDGFDPGALPHLEGRHR